MYTLLNKMKDKIRKATPAFKYYVFSTSGWYRIAEIPAGTVFSSILQITKGYNTGGSNGSIVAIEGLYNRAQASVLLPAISGNTGIKRLRISFKGESPYLIDAYYDDNKLKNTVSFRFIGNILSSNSVALPIFPDELTPSTIPTGYNTTEYDLTKFGLGGTA